MSSLLDILHRIIYVELARYPQSFARGQGKISFRNFTPPPGIEPGSHKGLVFSARKRRRTQNLSFALKTSAIPLCDGGINTSDESEPDFKSELMRRRHQLN